MRKPGAKLWMPALAVLAAGSLLASDAAVAQDYEARRTSSGETPLGATMTGQTRRDSAGWIEAKLLSGLVVKEVARRIVDATGTDFSSLSFVVLPVPKEAQDASSTVGGMGWDVIQGADQLPVVADMVRVRDRLEQFRQRHGAIAQAGVRACRAHAQAELPNKGVVDRLDTITGALHAATPLLNLLKQDFYYQGINAKVREGMLVTAVRGEIAARRKPPTAVQTGGAGNLTQAVDAVGQQLGALPEAARCGDADGGAEAARAALAVEFDAFRNDLAGPASVPGMSLLAAAEEQLQRYGPRPATLVLAIDADGASLVERKNLTTMFGAESTTISSGIVVSYEFYEPQSDGLGSLKAAGVLSCMSGAVGIRAIHEAKKIRSRAACF